MTNLLRLFYAAIVFVLFGCASTTKTGVVGVDRQQLLLVSAQTVERMALVSYAKSVTEAQSNGRLITSGAEYERLLFIAKRVKAQVGVFRDDALAWKWQLALIDSPELNASCAPGGKVTFYTGLIRKLQLTDSEIAAVMGHEIAHALREHGRERVSQAYAQNLITSAALAGTTNKQSQIELANVFAKYLFVLPNSREKETEADKIGLELAARAGYDPYGAVSVWQKMSASGGRETPQFLSTHPAHNTRIAEISSLIPAVLPLYHAAAKP